MKIITKCKNIHFFCWFRPNYFIHFAMVDPVICRFGGWGINNPRIFHFPNLAHIWHLPIKPAFKRVRKSSSLFSLLVVTQNSDPIRPQFWDYPRKPSMTAIVAPFKWPLLHRRWCCQPGVIISVRVVPFSWKELDQDKSKIRTSSPSKTSRDQIFNLWNIQTPSLY